VFFSCVESGCRVFFRKPVARLEAIASYFEKIATMDTELVEFKSRSRHKIKTPSGVFLLCRERVQGFL
jgi:hypothetical protein